VVPGGEGHQRRLDSPLAGRADELALLRDRFQRVVTDGSPQLVTVLGDAGIGKSRLVGELLASISEQATVLKGRCLPYGDGITYWPLREIVFAAADIGEGDSGDEAKAKLLELLAGAPDAELLARRVGTALGLEAEAAPQEEIFWAVRRLLEHLAASWPLVTVWEDIHWAEPTLLDLMEYLLDMATDVPVLFLCPARPELLEARPGWGGTRQNSSTLHLEALSDDAAASLLDSLPGASALPPGLRSRIQTAAEGNPLYLEEMLGMLVDDGHLVQDEGHWVARDDLEAVQVPPSVRALLATRIDALPAVEQAVAKRASVAGRTFEAAAVREMTPEFAADVGRSLLGLVRKELVRPERSEVGPGDAFKFRHLLIRDAAYEALSKSERASLHERFADWLARVSGDRIEEYEEILGYHLEQAAGYRRELGQTSDAERLGSAAGEYFLTAGTRADRRGDNTAVIPLMRKASELLQGAARNDALLVLATALSGAGEYGESRGILERVRDAAGGAGDRVMERRATIRWSVIVIGEPEPGDAVIRAGLREAIDDLGPDGPDVELANAWLGIGLIAVDRSEEWTAFERSLDFARRGGDLRTASAAVGNLASALQVGPTPVAEALRTVEGFEADFAGNRRAFAVLKVAKAGLIAMLGQFDEARSLLKEAVDICGDLGLTSWQVLIRGEQAELELLAGNLPGAFEALRPTDELDEDIGPMRQWHQAVKVRVLAASGRSSEAVELADNFLDANAEALPDTDPKVHMGRASALRAMGALADARTDIERAIQLLTQYEALPHLGLALIERAEINRDAGDEDWRADLDRARDAFERKGHLVGLGLVQSFLDRE
jgi:tetratricopeptide (TPR) repeat protein